VLTWCSQTTAGCLMISPHSRCPVLTSISTPSGFFYWPRLSYHTNSSRCDDCSVCFLVPMSLETLEKICQLVSEGSFHISKGSSRTAVCRGCTSEVVQLI